MDLNKGKEISESQNKGNSAFISSSKVSDIVNPSYESNMSSKLENRSRWKKLPALNARKDLSKIVDEAEKKIEKREKHLIKKILTPNVSLKPIKKLNGSNKIDSVSKVSTSLDLDTTESKLIKSNSCEERSTSPAKPKELGTRAKSSSAKFFRERLQNYLLSSGSVIGKDPLPGVPKKNKRFEPDETSQVLKGLDGKILKNSGTDLEERDNGVQESESSFTKQVSSTNYEKRYGKDVKCTSSNLTESTVDKDDKTEHSEREENNERLEDKPREFSNITCDENIKDSSPKATNKTDTNDINKVFDNKIDARDIDGETITPSKNSNYEIINEEEKDKTEKQSLEANQETNEELEVQGGVENVDKIEESKIPQSEGVNSQSIQLNLTKVEPKETESVKKGEYKSEEIQTAAPKLKNGPDDLRGSPGKFPKRNSIKRNYKTRQNSINFGKEADGQSRESLLAKSNLKHKIDDGSQRPLPVVGQNTKKETSPPSDRGSDEIHIQLNNEDGLYKIPLKTPIGNEEITLNFRACEADSMVETEKTTQRANGADTPKAADTIHLSIPLTFDEGKSTFESPSVTYFVENETFKGKVEPVENVESDTDKWNVLPLGDEENGSDSENSITAEEFKELSQLIKQFIYNEGIDQSLHQRYESFLKSKTHEGHNSREIVEGDLLQAIITEVNKFMYGNEQKDHKEEEKSRECSINNKEKDSEYKEDSRDRSNPLTRHERANGGATQEEKVPSGQSLMKEVRAEERSIPNYDLKESLTSSENSELQVTVAESHFADGTLGEKVNSEKHKGGSWTRGEDSRRSILKSTKSSTAKSSSKDKVTFNDEILSPSKDKVASEESSKKQLPPIRRTKNTPNSRKSKNMVFDFLNPFRRQRPRNYRGRVPIAVQPNPIRAKKGYEYEDLPKKTQQFPERRRNSVGKIYIQDPTDRNNILVAEEIGYVYGDPRKHIKPLKETKEVQTVSVSDKKSKAGKKQNETKKSSFLSTKIEKKPIKKINTRRPDLKALSRLEPPREKGDYVIRVSKNLPKIQNKSVSFKEAERGIPSISSTIPSDPRDRLYGNTRDVAIDSQNFNAPSETRTKTKKPYFNPGAYRNPAAKANGVPNGIPNGAPRPVHPMNPVSRLRNAPMERRASFDGQLPPIRTRPQNAVNGEFFSNLHHSTSQPNLGQSSTGPVLPSEDPHADSPLRSFDDRTPLYPNGEGGGVEKGKKKGWGRVKELTMKPKSNSTFIDGLEANADSDGKLPGTNVPIVLLQGFFKNTKGSRSAEMRRREEREKNALPKALLEPNSLLRGALPILSPSLAALCLTFNIFIPGLGTMFSGFFGACTGRIRLGSPEKGDQKMMSILVTFLTGLVQMFTVSFFFVGWFWSIAWGILLVSIARKYKKHLMKQKKSKRNYNLDMVKVNAS